MATHSYRDTLQRPGLQPFLWTQFLGAFNDNLFKIAVSMLAVRTVTSDRAGAELAIVSAVFMLPFLLFSGYAGQLADVYSKRSVLVVSKSLEIVAASLGLVAFLMGHLQLTYAVLFLIALQATFFSPAKYGILPEILPDRDLSRANGLLEMSTFVAIVLGTSIGGYLFDKWSEQLWLVGLLVVAIAVIGTVLSFGIPQVAAAAPGRRIDRNPWGEIWHGVVSLRRDRVLWLSVIGISYFWFLGSLLQLVVILFGSQVMQLSDTWVALLTACAAIGIGAGSMAAGRLSGDKVELGLAPIGAIGMGVFAIALAYTRTFQWATLWLTAVGFCGGLFAVPLNALLQQRSGGQEKGRIMATNNFLNMIGIMLASAALLLFTKVLAWTPDRILLVFGVMTLVSSIYVLSVVPEFLIRFSLWMLTHTVYRIRILGQEHVPFRGPALLVCNHMSHVDGALVGACVQRFIRFLVYRPIYEHWAVHRLLKLMKAIPIAGGRDSQQSIDRARQELQNGHMVCIFAEGAISRTGNMLPFRRGFERIAAGLDVPIIPVYIDRVWGSIFSFKGGRFFWKWPVRVPYPVTVAFGRPMPSSTTAAEARLAVQTLACDLAIARYNRDESLGRQFIRTAKHQWRSFAMTDATTKAPLSFGRTLIAALLVSQWVRRTLPNQQYVGLLLPSSVGGALANIGLSLAGRVPVNLNFTAGRDAVRAAIDQCGIKTILTSRQFLSKANIDTFDGMIFLEDVMRELTSAAKLRMLVTAYLLPAWALNRLYVARADANSVATVIFSSGSTGVPKGVMLSHRNILANVDSIRQVYELNSDDVLIGVLPFFHSFGFTGTVWLPAVSGFGVVFHPNPMDAKAIGELAERYRGSVIISTPTFCSSYIRKCEPEQFKHLRYAIVGAERLREPIAAAFKAKFGLDLMEGYGCTEMAPVVAVNVPDVEDGHERQRGKAMGTVGHPLPGVAVKIVDPVTGEGPLFGTEGLLLVKGPNRMLGYLGDREKTDDVLRDDWYVTGDIATIDDAGFVRITDRLSRFSKIAGEMVPHMKVEEQLQSLVSDDCTAVVTAVPDEAKGERLVAFFTDADVTAAQLWERLRDSELPRLWLPKREDLHFVDAIPTLGTGKVDLRAVRQLAITRDGVSA